MPAVSGPAALPPHILGLMLAAAGEHVSVARQALSAGRRPPLLHALHQLKGLCAQAGLTDIADRVHELEDAVIASRGVAQVRALVNAELERIEDELAQVAGADRGAASVSLQAVADAVSRELVAVARRRGVVLDHEPPECGDATVPSPTAAVVVDIAGHLVRNAVVHGGRTGHVAVSIACHRDGDDLVCTVTSSDPGADGHGEVDRDAGRGVGIAAARARARALGGRLNIGRRRGSYRAVLRLPLGSSRPANGS